MLLRCLRVAALLLLAVVPAVAQVTLRVSTPEVRRQVVAAVESQLGALRHGDARRAYACTTSAVQVISPLRVFESMVRSDCPEMWGNSGAEFGIVHDDGDVATVLVHVFGAKRSATFDYSLVKEDGTWRIASMRRHQPIAGEEL